LVPVKGLWSGWVWEVCNRGRVDGGTAGAALRKVGCQQDEHKFYCRCPWLGALGGLHPWYTLG
jgi:hypothetical protein